MLVKTDLMKLMNKMKDPFVSVEEKISIGKTAIYQMSKIVPCCECLHRNGPACPVDDYIQEQGEFKDNDYCSFGVRLYKENEQEVEDEIS